MPLDDFMESEVAVAVAATAVVLSPGVRNLIRRGAVYGLARLLQVGPAIAPNGLEDITAQPAAEADAGASRPEAQTQP